MFFSTLIVRKCLLDIQADLAETAAAEELDIEAKLTKVEAEEAEELEEEEEEEDNEKASPKGLAFGHHKGKATSNGKKDTTDEDLDELIDKTLETSEVETYSRGESLGHAKKETVKGSEEKDSPPRGQAKGYGKKDVTDEDILELIDKTVETSEIETYSRGKSLGQAVKGSEEKDTPPRGQAEGHAKKEVTDEEVDDMIDEAFKGGETEKGGNAYAKGHGAPGKGDPAVELQSVLDELEKTNQAIDKLDAARAKRGGHGRASTNAKKGGYSFGWKRCGQWKEEEQPSRQQRKVEKGRQHLFDARSTSNVKLSSYKKLGSGFLYHAHYIKLECFTT